MQDEQDKIKNHFHIRVCAFALIIGAASLILIDFYFDSPYWQPIAEKLGANFSGIGAIYSRVFSLTRTLESLYLLGLLGLGLLIGNIRIVFLPAVGIALYTIPLRFRSFIDEKYFHLIGLVRVISLCLVTLTLTFLIVYLEKEKLWQTKWKYSLYTVAAYPIIIILPLYLLDYGIHEIYWNVAWIMFGIGLIKTNTCMGVNA